MHQTGSTLHGGRQEGQEGDDTDRCAGGQGQGEAEAPQEESTQGFGGEGELRAGWNGGERPTAEWASLGKQKGLRGHIV